MANGWQIDDARAHLGSRNFPTVRTTRVSNPSGSYWLVSGSSGKEPNASSGGHSVQLARDPKPEARPHQVLSEGRGVLHGVVNLNHILPYCFEPAVLCCV